MQTSRFQKILVLGSGNFGTCLAFHLSRIGHQVTIWTRNQDAANSINDHHCNLKYLTQFTLPKSINASCEPLSASFVASFDGIVVATPTQVMRQVLTAIKEIKEDAFIVSASKGIEIGTGKLPLSIIEDVFGKTIAEKATFLSGPSFAIEVMLMQPSAVSLGSKDEKRVVEVQQIFHDPLFRVYTCLDPIGLEVAGALKNVIAIASGVCAGLGYQNNSRAALITRGLSEMVRVGVALGANPLTFNGLGGVGDLFLTCSSEKSRNFTVGFRLGRGETLSDILSTMGSTAEGVTTAKSAYELVTPMNVSCPITTLVYQVLYENKPVKDAVLNLITRDAKPELRLT